MFWSFYSLGLWPNSFHIIFHDFCQGISKYPTGGITYGLCSVNSHVARAGVLPVQGKQFKRLGFGLVCQRIELVYLLSS